MFVFNNLKYLYLCSLDFLIRENFKTKVVALTYHTCKYYYHFQNKLKICLKLAYVTSNYFLNDLTSTYDSSRLTLESTLEFKSDQKDILSSFQRNEIVK